MEGGGGMTRNGHWRACTRDSAGAYRHKGTQKPVGTLQQGVRVSKLAHNPFVQDQHPIRVNDGACRFGTQTPRTAPRTQHTLRGCTDTRVVIK